MEWLDRVELPGRYEVQQHIANGGMASVWRARDHVLHRTVAIKLLADAYAVDETSVKRFEREARAAARVSAHPNMVTIYDFGVAPQRSEAPAEGGTPFIVMEYLPGGTVGDALRAADGAGIAPRVAVGWLEQAAAALDHAHSLGVVHRDVKPANMLLDSSRRLHLADFGIARLASEASITTIGEVLGTAAYLSPEQALGEPATPASDRYSLAVAAYELLVGARPFDADQVLAQRRAGREPPPPVPASEANPALPPGVDHVLERGMSPAAAKRWPAATDFALALELALQGPAAVQFAEPAPYAPFVSYRARRQRPPVWTGAVAGLAAVALGVGIAVGASGGGSSPGRTRTLASRSARLAGGHRSAPAPAVTQRSTTTTPPPTASPQDPTTLDVSGHQLMLQGDYSGAIVAMRRVLASTSPDTLLHAYALFDLGRSLRLSGDPEAAIPVLEQRLQYPNQTGVVRQELALAEQAAGTAPPGGPPASAGPPGQLKHPDHGHGGGPDGGAGLLAGPNGGPGSGPGQDTGQGGGGD